MDEAGIKAVLSSTAVINKWEEPPCSDLPKLVNSIRKVKESVNDYLTDLVSKEKGCGDKIPKSFENSDEEEEEEEEEDIEDTISGFIKETAVSEKMKKGSKRKVHAGTRLQEAKKKK